MVTPGSKRVKRLFDTILHLVTFECESYKIGCLTEIIKSIICVILVMYKEVNKNRFEQSNH